MSSDVLDLIGDDSDKKKPAREPRILEVYPGNTVQSAHKNFLAAKEAGIALDPIEVMAGVSVQWLATVFKMAPQTVRLKLIDCPKYRDHGNAPIYLLPQACGYLAKPRMDGTGGGPSLKNLKANDLPDELRTDYWDAKLKEQKFKTMAGDLWHTADVQELFGFVVTRIRSVLMLAPDSIEMLIPEARSKRKQLTAMFDSTLGTIHEKLASMVKERRTGSSAEKDEAGKA